MKNTTLGIIIVLFALGVGFFIFSNGSATATGKVVAISPNKLTVTTLDGQRSEFAISPTVNVYVYKDKNTPASVSNDIKGVDLNREVLLKMGLENNQYVVVTITVLPPTQSLSVPTASKSP